MSLFQCFLSLVHVAMPDQFPASQCSSLVLDFFFNLASMRFVRLALHDFSSWEPNKIEVILKSLRVFQAMIHFSCRLSSSTWLILVLGC